MSKFLFIIQGEGRGHLTQAISLQEILQTAGHEVVAAMVGLPKDREIPAFFFDAISCPIIAIESPSLNYGQKKEELSVGKTIRDGIFRMPIFAKSIHTIHKAVENFQPDAIINFYDLLTGIYNFLYRPNIPTICIGHQYLLLHESFIFPEKTKLDRFFLNLNTKLTALRATKKLALSFDKRPNDDANNIIVVPPLLREDVKKLSSQHSETPFLLVYLNLTSMADSLLKWHSQNPKTIIHCFCDRTQMKDEFKYANSITFHKINGQKFLEMMQKCSGLVTSAGFESVCEAMSLGKPVLMIPIKNHFEQACNALDGVAAGAGITEKTVDLTSFMHFLPTYKDISPVFNAWQKNANQLFMREIESVLKPTFVENQAYAWQPVLAVQ